MGHEHVDGETSKAPERRIDLWRRPVHIATAHLMLDLTEHRLRIPPYGELARPYAFGIVATDSEFRVLAATVGRERFAEVAVKALDKAVAAMVREHQGRSSAFWRLLDERLVVTTDALAPFSTERFRQAVRDLGCTHRVRAPRGRRAQAVHGSGPGGAGAPAHPKDRCRGSDLNATGDEEEANQPSSLKRTWVQRRGVQSPKDQEHDVAARKCIYLGSVRLSAGREKRDPPSTRSPDRVFLYVPFLQPGQARDEHKGRAERAAAYCDPNIPDVKSEFLLDVNESAACFEDRLEELLEGSRAIPGRLVAFVIEEDARFRRSLRDGRKLWAILKENDLEIHGVLAGRRLTKRDLVRLEATGRDRWTAKVREELAGVRPSTYPSLLLRFE